MSADRHEDGSLKYYSADTLLKAFPPPEAPRWVKPKVIKKRGVKSKVFTNTYDVFKYVKSLPQPEVFMRCNGGKLTGGEVFELSLPRNGKIQIRKDGKPTPNWIDLNINAIFSNNIKGSYGIVEFAQYYGLDLLEISEELKILFPEYKSKMTIQPVPTKYKNQIFRSRLEARWAVFFDALNLAWEYEPDGYALGMSWYLPDFYLPDLSCFAEVKHKGGSFKKAYQFVSVVNKPIWLCEGPPEAKVYKLLDRREETGTTTSNVIPCWDQAMDENRFFWEPGYEEPDGTFTDDWCDMNPRYMNAVEAALNYNFV